MARPSLTVALLRVMQSSSGISQPARLSHKACRWHTRIISIRICQDNAGIIVSQISKRPITTDPVGSDAIHSASEVPTSLPRATLRASLQASDVCFITPCGPASCAVLPIAAVSNRYIRLFFSYILKALRMGLTAIGASLRPDEFSTDPQLRPSPYSIPQNEHMTRVQDTPKSQYFQSLNRTSAQSNTIITIDTLAPQVKTEHASEPF